MIAKNWGLAAEATTLVAAVYLATQPLKLRNCRLYFFKLTLRCRHLIFRLGYVRKIFRLRGRKFFFQCSLIHLRCLIAALGHLFLLLKSRNRFENCAGRLIFRLLHIVFPRFCRRYFSPDETTKNQKLKK